MRRDCLKFGVCIAGGMQLFAKNRGPERLNLMEHGQAWVSHFGPPLNVATMASPLRCARSGAGFTAQTPSIPRAANLPTVCRRYLNQDVRITRTGKPILTVSGGRYRSLAPQDYDRELTEATDRLSEVFTSSAPAPGTPLTLDQVTLRPFLERPAFWDDTS